MPEKVQRIHVKRVLSAAVVMGLMVVGSACSSTTGGSPTTAPDSTTTTRVTGTTTGMPTKSTSPPEDTNKLKDLDPCELISASSAATLGITGQPEPGGRGDSRNCLWRVRKDSVADSYTIGVGLFEKLGLKDVIAEGEIKPIRIGDHEAGQSMRGQGGTCAVTIAITEKSRVDVQASGGDGSKLCSPALEAAKVIEPELP